MGNSPPSERCWTSCERRTRLPLLLRREAQCTPVCGAFGVYGSSGTLINHHDHHARYAIPQHYSLADNYSNNSPACTPRQAAESIVARASACHPPAILAPAQMSPPHPVTRGHSRARRMAARQTRRSLPENLPTQLGLRAENSAGRSLPLGCTPCGPD